MSGLWVLPDPVLGVEGKPVSVPQGCLKDYLGCTVTGILSGGRRRIMRKQSCGSGDVERVGGKLLEPRWKGGKVRGSPSPGAHLSPLGRREEQAEDLWSGGASYWDFK